MRPNLVVVINGGEKLSSHKFDWENKWLFHWVRFFSLLLKSGATKGSYLFSAQPPPYCSFSRENGLATYNCFLAYQSLHIGLNKDPLLTYLLVSASHLF